MMLLFADLSHILDPKELAFKSEGWNRGSFKKEYQYQGPTARASHLILPVMSEGRTL